MLVMLSKAETGMKRVVGVKDRGIVLAPDKEGEAMYRWDGGGMKDVVVSREIFGAKKGLYYLSYDGIMPGKKPDCYWTPCSAVSEDLVHWKKVGPKVPCSAILHPDGNAEDYKDFCGICSPWPVAENGHWYSFYCGAEDCSDEGIPSPGYYTLFAEAETLDGPWIKHVDKPGCARHVCFPVGKPGEWDDATASAGVVIRNPKWKENHGAKTFIIFYSGSRAVKREIVKGRVISTEVDSRSLGIAKTDDLTVSDDHAKKQGEGNFWEKVPGPLFPPEHDIENTDIFYEESTGLYWLFTNHIHDNLYTNSVWVYWTKDIDHWDPENRAVAFDAEMSSWAKGAIGMAAVIKKDEKTLCMFFDAIDGDGIDHLDRKVGMCEIPLPIRVK